MEQALHIDVPGSVSAFEAAAHYFELRTKLYRVLFRGKGLEFERYRGYAPDDDAGLIDWGASLRSQRLLVRQYREEKDLNIMFLINVSDISSLGFW